MKKQKNSLPKLNWDLFESVIAYNSLIDEVYLTTIIDSINPKYFNNKDIKIIFNIVADFYKKRNTIPNSTEIKLFLTTSEQKEAFKRVLKSFSGLDKKYDQTELIVNTERFFRERAVQIALLDTAEKCSNNEMDSNEVYDIFSNACGISLVDNLGCDYFGDIDTHIENLHKSDTYISTGYPWLDKKIGGGLLEHGKSLYIFSGSTNSGKSIILGNIAGNIIAGGNKSAIIISMEMSEDIYAKRISSKLSQIPMGKIALQTDELKTFLYDYKNKKPNAKLFIKEYAPKTITCNHIRSYIQKLINKKGIKPGVIVVDYVNLMLPSIITGDSYTDIKSVSEQLRALSYIFGCPVISATQLNRSGYDKVNPGLETTSESMGLTHTADVQVAIWSNENDKDLGIIHLGMQKNRYGANFGTKALRIDYDTLSVYETDDDIISNSDLNEADNTISDILNKI